MMKVTTMMDIATMSTPMFIGMGIMCLSVLVFVWLGIAAEIKYLRS